ncbi:hemerythrin domain-containing protein [Nocardia sp. CDC159]|uniref:Hemerythrin domain-containing protein n=1 Tax=Nocardia pulmonis TaxID=2951408 RepID=A0A9X2IWM7_9NOCA|nr:MULTISPECIES: hemerythrin domain-containing protein [Nocardia]MCM6772046.1 hemerythrin domain-containing protein [Nocardia pulmonis]MCM6785296.1 hemerythrin domain-containing protein [Nocardia sp. CDC159]
MSDSTEEADAVELLCRQHRRLRTLFTETAQAADTGERERKFFELRRLLAVHETAEEEIVHPRARRTLDAGDTVVRARLAEENKAKHQLAELESLDVGSAEFEAKLAQLERDVLAHADREEREEFAALRDGLAPEELRRMRRLVELAESVAPTRPHPGVESATANLLTGPFATMVDRARDLIARRG